MPFPNNYPQVQREKLSAEFYTCETQLNSKIKKELQITWRKWLKAGHELAIYFYIYLLNKMHFMTDPCRRE